VARQSFCFCCLAGSRCEGCRLRHVLRSRPFDGRVLSGKAERIFSRPRDGDRMERSGTATRIGKETLARRERRGPNVPTVSPVMVRVLARVPVRGYAARPGQRVPPLSGPLQPRFINADRLGQRPCFPLGQPLLRCLGQRLGQIIGAARGIETEFRRASRTVQSTRSSGSPERSLWLRSWRIFVLPRGFGVPVARHRDNGAVTAKRFSGKWTQRCQSWSGGRSIKSSTSPS